MKELSNWKIIERLLRLSWRFKWRSLQVIGSQFLLLSLTLGGLGFIGLGIDYLRHVLMDGPEPRWPFGLIPPADANPTAVLAVIAGAVAAAALLRGVLDYVYQMAVGRLVHVEIILYLRGLVYEKMQSLSFRFFDRNASGTLINRVTSDVQSVRMFIDQVLIQIFIMALSLAIYLAYMISVHPMLTLACLATTPLLWVLTAMFSSRLHPAYRESRILMDDLVLNFSETLQGMLTIKGFSLEGRQEEVFEAHNQRVAAQRQGIFKLASTFSPIIGFLTQVNIFVLLLYGGWLVVHDQLPLGAGLVVFAGLLQQFSSQIANIGGITDSIQQSLAGARRVFEVLDAPREIDDPLDPVVLDKVNGEITFENVSFSFENSNELPQTAGVLHSISFTAKPGEIIAIAGATGSGKSALMSLIPRFYDPTGGRILLDGHDLRTLKVEQLRQKIGIVFQDNFLFSNSIARNIAFGAPHATKEQVEKAARIACAHDFILEMPNGYDTLLSESGANLSGGQRQRLAIARALLLEPAILLLDDPTAAIDPETEDVILQAIEKAIEGRTTFIVAHRLSTLRRAHRVIVLEHGRIVQCGHHEELMQQEGLYRRAVELQAVDPESMRLLREAEQRRQK